MAHIIGKGWGYPFQSEILQHIQKEACPDINKEGIIKFPSRFKLHERGNQFQWTMVDSNYSFHLDRRVDFLST